MNLQMFVQRLNIHSSIACHISIYNCGPHSHYKGRIQESVLRIQAHPRYAHLLFIFPSRKTENIFNPWFFFSSRVGTKSGPCRGTPLGPVVMWRPGLGPGQSEASVRGVAQWEARDVCHLLFTRSDLGVRTWGRVSQRQWATLIMYTCTKMLKWLFQTRYSSRIFSATTMDRICSLQRSQEAGVTTLPACCDPAPHSSHSCSLMVATTLGAADQVNTSRYHFHKSSTGILRMYFDQRDNSHQQGPKNLPMTNEKASNKGVWVIIWLWYPVPRSGLPPANLLDSISIILGTPPFICGPGASDESLFRAPIGQTVQIWVLIGLAETHTPSLNPKVPKSVARHVW